jgi:hypothetical protein
MILTGHTGNEGRRHPSSNRHTGFSGEGHPPRLEQKPSLFELTGQRKLPAITDLSV